MKIEDIVFQLQNFMPQQTTLFNDSVAVESLTARGNTVTGTCNVAHNLITGQYVNITGAYQSISVDSMTRLNDVVTVITSDVNDITVGSYETVTIVGADQPEYNNTFKTYRTRNGCIKDFNIAPVIMVSTVNTIDNVATVKTITPHGFVSNNNFEIQISASIIPQYNGVYRILSIIDDYQFTIAVNGNPSSFIGSMKVQALNNAYTFFFIIETTPISPATGSISLYQQQQFGYGFNGNYPVIFTNNWAYYNTATDSPTTIVNNSSPFIKVNYYRLTANINIDSTRFMLVYLDNNYNTYAVIANLDYEDNVTYGTPYLIASGTSLSHVLDMAATLLDSSRIVIAINDNGIGKLITINYNNLSITSIGTATIYTNTTDLYTSITAISSSEILLYYKDTTLNTVNVIYASITGSVITLGNNLALGNPTDIYGGYIESIDNGNAILVHSNLNNGKGTAHLISVTGNTPSDIYSYDFYNVLNDLIVEFRLQKVGINQVVAIWNNSTQNSIDTCIIYNDKGTLYNGSLTNIFSNPSNTDSGYSFSLAAPNNQYIIFSFFIDNRGIYSGILNINRDNITVISFDNQLNVDGGFLQSCIIGTERAAIFYNQNDNTDRLLIMSAGNGDVFEYTANSITASNAIGNITALSNPRISGAVNIERAIASYTPLLENELWAYVTLDDEFVSKDRRTNNDSTATVEFGQDYHLYEVRPFSIYVVTPTTDELAGRIARDLMVDVKKYLYKCLLRARFPNDLSTKYTLGTVVPVGNGIHSYNNGYLIHRFQFEVIGEILFQDTINADYNVPFRKIYQNINNDITPSITADIINLNVIEDL